MARGFSRGGGGGGRSGGSGGGFSFGGGSSRSSGGFSFGSSSSSSRRDRDYDSYSGGHYHRRPRRPWHVPMFGRTIIITPGIRSAFSFLLIIFVFAIILCVTWGRTVGGYADNIKDQKELVEYYETYDKDYKTLIKNVNDGKAGFEKQTFDITPFYNSSTNDFNWSYVGYSDPTEPGIYDIDLYRNGQEYYFILYEYTWGGQPYTDWTFAQYTEYQLLDIIRDGGTIEIGVGKLTNTASGDDGIYAMNMDYSLEKNQEYQYEVASLKSLKSMKNRHLFMCLGAGAVAALILTGMIVYVVKKYKSAKVKEDLENKKTEAEIAEAKAQAEIAEKKAEQMNRVCKYCGANVPDGEETCPGCGSREFE